LSTKAEYEKEKVTILSVSIICIIPISEANQTSMVHGAAVMLEMLHCKVCEGKHHVTTISSVSICFENYKTFSSSA
jgi:hypothetical protein